MDHDQRVYKIRGALRLKPVCYLIPNAGFRIEAAHDRFLTDFCTGDCRDAADAYFEKIASIRWNLWRSRRELQFTCNPLLDQLDRVFAEWCALAYKGELLEEEEFQLLTEPIEVIPFIFTIDPAVETSQRPN